MNGRLKGFGSRIWACRRANMLIVCMILVLAVAAAGFNLTKEKAQNIVAADVKVENKGGVDMATNPLETNAHPDVEKVVQDYYAGLAENTEFVERYDHVQVFTKAGKYEGSYVVFARYEMKIKDIYTQVPGLGTLYVEKNEESGKLHVDTRTEALDVQEYVKTVASHEDVQALMTSIQTDYTNAVASDALLAEALQDLKNAYEESTATNSAQ